MLIIILPIPFLTGKGQSAVISKWANTHILHEEPLQQAHVGISIYEPATGKYWYQYQDDKYFTPASNTKIFSLYTGLKILGDSLPGIRYYENDTALFVKGMGDPSFLHPDFQLQRVMQLMQETSKKIYVIPAANENKRFGPGWSWADYADYYQPELSEWPMYGNVARVYHHGDTSAITPATYDLKTQKDDTLSEAVTERDERNNTFSLKYNSKDKSIIKAEVPFITGSEQQLRSRLEDTLHKHISLAVSIPVAPFKVLHSIPVDSLFTPMMHRSDNLFAEQTMMMSWALLRDTISTRRCIDYMLNGSLRSLPHPPQWEDGSGLSRYNLFTPRDFVTVLTMMYNEYPKERLWQIFPTGGKGTLRNYYKEQFIHAKTGTLSGVVALSGYLVTKKNKTLVFSVLVNNHMGKAVYVRRAVEQLLTMIWKNY
ncbi:MAG TPA: D-alanyl-D-alanine carboxypeptidase [Chitinophaga sp.]|uniref:D-alanyl-D-alanine carboxypeptidase n=1 Tax=Chitinophaga sp. TaxID=1869181 RepID=UPI002C1D2A97|nr:D-alanyl-D-alanine carboxypeptidase [Chitinophaga sp.]HVI45919.1 D-alanyl-D-alanine carboxypeptidase [Chitinophaga sp.]